MQAGPAWFPWWWFPPTKCLPPAQSHGDQLCASSLQRDLQCLLCFLQRCPSKQCFTPSA